MTSYTAASAKAAFDSLPDESARDAWLVEWSAGDHTITAGAREYSVTGYTQSGLRIEPVRQPSVPLSQVATDNAELAAATASISALEAATTLFTPQTPPAGPTVVYPAGQTYRTASPESFVLRVTVNGEPYELLPRSGAVELTKNIFDTDAIDHWVLPKRWVNRYDADVSHLYEAGTEVVAWDDVEQEDHSYILLDAAVLEEKQESPIDNAGWRQTTSTEIAKTVRSNVRVDVGASNKHPLVQEWFPDANGNADRYRYDFDLMMPEFLGVKPSLYPDDSGYLAYQLRHSGEDSIYWCPGITPYLRENVHTVKTQKSDGTYQRWDVAANVPTEYKNVHPALIAASPYYRPVVETEIQDVYEEPTPSATEPGVTNPAPENPISGASVVFTWSARSTTVKEWYFRIGGAPNTNGIFDSGKLPLSQTSITATGLPADGSTIYVMLQYKTPDGPWLHVNHTYTSNA